MEEIPPEYLKEERVGFMQTREQARRKQERDDYFSGWEKKPFSWTEDAEPAAPRGGWKDFGEDHDFSYSSTFRKPAAGKAAPRESASALIGRFRQGEPAAEPAPKKEILTAFSPGDRVVSKRFGAGTVVMAEQGKRDLEVTVDFDNYGRKVLLAGFAAFTREE